MKKTNFLIKKIFIKKCRFRIKLQLKITILKNMKKKNFIKKCRFRIKLQLKIAI